MTRAAAIALALTAACSSAPPVPAPTPEPLRFRVISEGANATPCVEAPDATVARDEDAWIDVFDRQTGCLPDGDLELPQVDFSRALGVAVWWSSDACADTTVETTAVDVVGEALVIHARTAGASAGGCAPATLESFLTVRRSPTAEVIAQVRLRLDDAEVETIPV